MSQPRAAPAGVGVALMSDARRDRNVAERFDRYYAPMCRWRS
jgi:hypothetical protein